MVVPKRTWEPRHGGRTGDIALILIGWIGLGNSACWNAAPAPESRETGGPPEASSGSDFIVDDLGRRVSLTPIPTRIATLTPSNTEIAFALGCGPKVVLRDRWSDHPPEARTLPEADGFQLNLERVAAFRPDLILTAHLDRPRVEALEKVGARVVCLNPQSLPAVWESMRLVARLCGAPADATARIAQWAARVDAVRERLRGRTPPTVFLEIDAGDPSRPYTAGPDSWLAEVLAAAGGRNAATGLGAPWGAMDAEAVIRSDPDYIVLIHDTPGAVPPEQRPGWGVMRAVREHRVVTHIPATLLNRPGPRVVDGIEALAKILHPEAFR